MLRRVVGSRSTAVGCQRLHPGPRACGGFGDLHAPHLHFPASCAHQICNPRLRPRFQSIPPPSLIDVGNMAPVVVVRASASMAPGKSPGRCRAWRTAQLAVEPIAPRLRRATRPAAPSRSSVRWIRSPRHVAACGSGSTERGMTDAPWKSSTATPTGGGRVQAGGSAARRGSEPAPALGRGRQPGNARP